jgi:hypothetical protein
MIFKKIIMYNKEKDIEIEDVKGLEVCTRDCKIVTEEKYDSIKLHDAYDIIIATDKEDIRLERFRVIDMCFRYSNGRFLFTYYLRKI